MPVTRKKVVKTVYKNEDSDEDTGDFSDSGSEAQISDEPSSEDEEVELAESSGDEFLNKNKKTSRKSKPPKKPFAKTLINKITKQSLDTESTTSTFTVKDLTDEDKLLPPILNLSESDSSDDETPKATSKKPIPTLPEIKEQDTDTDENTQTNYKDVWSQNLDPSEEIAKKAFMELEQHKNKIEEVKESVQNYKDVKEEKESDVKDLLALGEEPPSEKSPIKKKTKLRKIKNESDSEIDDWEEVSEAKTTPQQGIQLIVKFPDAVCKKRKTIDVEMMMKRKINRTKKETRVFMHKVHVLCWLGYGNYVSRVINDQDIMAVALSLVPSKDCYPKDRVDMKYIEQITKWYRDKLVIKQDKNEDKFKPKASPLKSLLLEQINNKTVTTKKYFVFVFVALLRALGLQCRVMLNFVTLSLKPPSSDLYSLATKPNKDKKDNDKIKSEKTEENQEKYTEEKKKSNSKNQTKTKISQIDGNDDRNKYEIIMQVDGNDDTIGTKMRSSRSTRVKAKEENEEISPPKRSKKNNEAHELKLESVRKNPITLSKNNKQLQNTAKILNDENDDNNASNRSSPRLSRNQIIKSNFIEISDLKTKNNRTSEKVDLKSQNIKQVSNPVLDMETEDSNVTSRSSPRLSRNRMIKPSVIEILDLKTKDNTTLEKVNSKLQSTKQISNLVLDIENDDSNASSRSSPRLSRNRMIKSNVIEKSSLLIEGNTASEKLNPKSRSTKQVSNYALKTYSKLDRQKAEVIPKIIISDEKNKSISSKYFESKVDEENICKTSRKRSHTAENIKVNKNSTVDVKKFSKARTKSVPSNEIEKSKYFCDTVIENKRPKLSKQTKEKNVSNNDNQRISHRDLAKTKSKPQLDVTDDLVNIIKNRIKDAKNDSKKLKVKGKKIKKESDNDSDFLPEEEAKRNAQESDDDFKPAKTSPRPSTSKTKDRRVLSSDDEKPKNKVDVWCEIFTEELEQWISVDVVNGKIHNTDTIYTHATHPVCYIVGWDNNNYLKDVTRRYVPHYNTVTRKMRAELDWWEKALKPWMGPKTARDREEDEYLNKMQLEAPLPKTISEYKNHPLYALKRHILKFEALYPPDAATLGFVRGEAVYSRDCVYICRSRDIWLKEAKVVKLGEKPYKIVKARPKWDRLSNQLIRDKVLELYGPWQVQDYEPPVAENGIVPRNAYGNVELFKECMLPKGTVRIKLPGLNKVARKLNIDCAPAMTGFDYDGGYCHPVYDGFVVCTEFEEVLTEAWVKDQEEQEKREREKTEARVYGNWKRLIRGLRIRERIKDKYGFEKLTETEPVKSKGKGPRLVVKKK